MCRILPSDVDDWGWHRYGFDLDYSQDDLPVVATALQKLTPVKEADEEADEDTEVSKPPTHAIEHPCMC